MKLAHVVVLFAVVLVSGVSMSGAGAQFCAMPVAAAEAAIRATVPPNMLEIEQYDGPAAEHVLARLNAEPPVTDFTADSVLVAYWIGRPGAVVILGIDGCVTGQITLPAARARALFGETL